MNTRKIEIPFGDGKIIAEVNDMGLPEIPAEIAVYVVDKDGIFVQDLCLVGEHYEHNSNDGVFERDTNHIDCFIWNNANSEDYTNRFVIEKREEQEK